MKPFFTKRLFISIIACLSLGVFSLNPAVVFAVEEPINAQTMALSSTTDTSANEVEPNQQEVIKDPETDNDNPLEQIVSEDDATGLEVTETTYSALTDTEEKAAESFDKEQNSGTVSESNLETDEEPTIDNQAAIENNINSQAISGDALLSNNQIAKDALSGNAEAIVNLFNLINSYWSELAGQMILFNQDINGDVFGDILIDPSILTPLNNDLPDGQVNITDDQRIDNDIKVKAVSGQTEVSDNEIAGNAVSGNATAMVNLINLINSSIAAGNSFLGTLNIYGNLNGDILLPEGFVTQLLNDSSENFDSDYDKSNLDGQEQFNQVINNEVFLSAESGKAEVIDNKVAGNATSGDALTQLSIINLTGREIVAKDALIVFVNNMGNWTGLILNAPAGTTSGFLGGGVNTSNIGFGDFDYTGNYAIDNNIKVEAASGAALVKNNGYAKDAKSGDAKASVSIANITNSSFSLTEWFGILFINVFGNWHGSFAIDTEAGENNGYSDSEEAPFVFVPDEQWENSYYDNEMYDNYSGFDQEVSLEDYEQSQKPKNTDRESKILNVLGTSDTTKYPPASDSNLIFWLTVPPFLFTVVLAIVDQLRRKAMAAR